MAVRILVMDDDDSVRASLGACFAEEGWEAVEASHASEATRLLDAEVFDLAILDLELPGGDGLGLLANILGAHPAMAVIVLAAHSSVDNAVEAIKQGAFDYLSKPLDADELMAKVRAVFKTSEVRRAIRSELDQKKRRFGVASMVGDSRLFQDIKDMICRVAASDSTTLLLLGETGTGKDMAARAVHYESGRVEKPFMNITCTAMPESLIESELFGYEEGAFTNATGRKRGLFELGHGGTIFLDEIGDMPPNLQAKLLRILEERCFRRIGGAADIQVDCRVIAATNRDLAKLIDEGKFREDLYYRLSTIPVTLPPLRERIDDVPPVARHFLDTYNRKLKRHFRGLTEQAEEKLKAYHWPGNVRELRNVIERAVLLTTGDAIDAGDIALGRADRKGAKGKHAVALPKEGCKLSEIEESLLVQALERTQGNQTKAAKLLGITRDQLRYKVEKYGIV